MFNFIRNVKEIREISSFAISEMQTNPIESVWFIGNGFDLACGLNTEYLDFLGIKEFNCDKKSLEIDTNGYLFIKKSNENTTIKDAKKRNIERFKEHIIENIESKKKAELKKKEAELKRIESKEKNELKDIREKCWVDLEILLGEIAGKYKKDVDDFLCGFDDLHTSMNEYLTEVEKKYEIAISKPSEDEKKQELEKKRRILKTYFKNIDIKATVFLIMNYTENFEKFIKEIYPDYTEDFWMSRIIYVHGKLSENNTVLGVADPFQIKNIHFKFHPSIQKIIKVKKTGQYSCLENSLINLLSIRVKGDKLNVHIFGCSMGQSDNMFWSHIFKGYSGAEKLMLRIYKFKFSKTLPKITLYDRVFIDEKDYKDTLVKFNESYTSIVKEMYNKEMDFERYINMITKVRIIMRSWLLSSFVPSYFYIFNFFSFPKITNWIYRTVSRKIDNSFELVNNGYNPDNPD